MNRRATDVDRAFSAIGVQIKYVTFGPRKLPETSNELKKIFFYNDLGEGEYRAPVVLEEDPTLSLPGLPGAVQEAALPEQPPIPQPPIAPEQPIPIAARAPQPQQPPRTQPRPQVQPQPQAQPVLPSRGIASQNPPSQNPPPLPGRVPLRGVPVQASAPQPEWRPNLTHSTMPPPGARPNLPMPVNDGFGLPEIGRERREVRNPATAPVVEERSLAAMFRMLGSRAHGNLTEIPGEDDEPTDPNGNDLFRRL